MAETLSVISLLSFIGAGVFGILAMVLWFLFRIPSVIGDLSGRTAKKTLERMRKNNERAGNRSFQPGKILNTESQRESMTEKKQTGETGVLIRGEATGRLLNTEGTTLMEERQVPKRKEPEVRITLIEEILFVHTDEMIR